MRRSLFALALLASTSAAHAADQSTTVRCSAATRIDITGVVNEPTTITYPASDQFYRIVETFRKGDDGKLKYPWRIPAPDQVKEVPLGNNVPLWPSMTDETIITLITLTKAGTQRVCNFHAVALPDGSLGTAKAVFNVIVEDGAPRPPPPAPLTPTPAAPTPATPAAKPQQTAVATPIAVAAWRLRKAQKDQEAAEAANRVAIDAYNGPCHYTAQGKRPNGINPMCPMDNGVWTLIRFQGLTNKPAVYIMDADGTPESERLAPQHAAGDFVVVEAIAPRLRLRLGQAVLDVVNNQYNQAGHPSDTGTVNPGERRTLLTGKPIAVK